MKRKLLVLTLAAGITAVSFAQAYDWLGMDLQFGSTGTVMFSDSWGFGWGLNYALGYRFRSGISIGSMIHYNDGLYTQGRLAFGGTAGWATDFLGLNLAGGFLASDQAPSSLELFLRSSLTLYLPEQFSIMAAADYRYGRYTRKELSFAGMMRYRAGDAGIALGGGAGAGSPEGADFGADIPALFGERFEPFIRMELDILGTSLYFAWHFDTSDWQAGISFGFPLFSSPAMDGGRNVSRQNTAPGSVSRNYPSITIVNNTGAEIWYVNISPVESNVWGEDWLGSSETLPNGASRSFTLREPLAQVDRYDIRLVDRFGNTYERRDMSITPDRVITFSRADSHNSSTELRSRGKMAGQTEPGGNFRLRFRPFRIVPVCGVNVPDSVEPDNRDCRVIEDAKNREPAASRSHVHP